jgi:hypothetical protein
LHVQSWHSELLHLLSLIVNSRFSEMTFFSFWDKPFHFFIILYHFHVSRNLYK